MVMGVPTFPMPIPAPIDGAMVGLGDATVLVMVGRDLAGKPLGTPPATTTTTTSPPETAPPPPPAETTPPPVDTAPPPP
jgi:hypothetical protein